MRHESDRSVVFYFSDMHESMHGSNRRDFHQRPPRNRQQAHEWASEDAAWIADNMSLDTERMSTADVTVFLGGHGNLAGAPHVRAYWERLFDAVGVGSVVFD
jgi:hypothetical protein